MAPIRPVLRNANVTEQQWRVLRVLADDGQSDPSLLAQSALLHSPSVTRILKELTERGLITRTADNSDRRRQLIEITPEGADLVERTAAHTLTIVDLYGRLFGRERMNQLVGELRALAIILSGEDPAEGSALARADKNEI